MPSLTQVPEAVSREARAADRRVLRYVLQAAARSALGHDHRVAVCLRRRRSKRMGVEVYHAPQFNAAHFGNLIVCGLHWVCPVCAAKIAARRLVEVEQAVSVIDQFGGTVLFVTNTVPHYARDELAPLLGGFLDALRRFKSARRYRELVNASGFLGEIRSLEVTHGENGWHPHTHSLLFFSEAVDVAQIGSDLRDQWRSVAERRGLGTVNRHGLNVRLVGAGAGESRETVAGYMVKSGEALDASVWGPADELVKGNTKQARRGGRTPFAILADSAVHLDEIEQQRSRTLFREYEAAFKGKNHLVWSRQLRELLGLSFVPLSDQAVAEQQTEPADLLGIITSEQWRSVLCAGPGARGELLEVARGGDWGAVLHYVEGLQGVAW